MEEIEKQSESRKITTLEEATKRVSYLDAGMERAMQEIRALRNDCIAERTNQAAESLVTRIDQLVGELNATITNVQALRYPQE
jgi:hypothetical protein